MVECFGVPSRFEKHDSLSCIVVGSQHRNPVDEGKCAALAAEHRMDYLLTVADESGVVGHFKRGSAVWATET